MRLTPKLAARYPRDVLMLCAASGLISAGFLGLRQLLYAIYLLRLGFGADTVGTMSAASALSFSLASLPGGALGTRLGLRRTMILGTLVNMLGMALLPLMETAPEASRLTLALSSQIVSAVGWAFFMVSVLAAVADVTTPATRRGAYALREASAGLGSFAGSLLGGLLPGVLAGVLGTTTEEALPYRYALWGSMALSLAALMPLLSVTSTEGQPRSVTASARFRVGLPLALLVVAAFFGDGAHAACGAFASAYLDTAHRLPTSLIGTIISVAMLLSIVAALGSQRLLRGRSSGRILIAGSLALGASLLLMAWVPHWIGGALGTIGVYTILALWRPSLQALQMEMVAPAWRSLVSGATSMGLSLGYGSMSFAGGLVVARSGFDREFLLGAGLAAASAATFLILQRCSRRT